MPRGRPPAVAVLPGSRCKCRSVARLSSARGWGSAQGLDLGSGLCSARLVAGARLGDWIWARVCAQLGAGWGSARGLDLGSGLCSARRWLGLGSGIGSGLGSVLSSALAGARLGYWIWARVCAQLGAGWRVGSVWKPGQYCKRNNA